MDNKIPDGATHLIADVYSLSENQKRMNDKHPYRMIKDGIWYAFVNGGWWPVTDPEPGRYQRIEKQWSGPQDGLPPLGTNVIFNGLDEAVHAPASMSDWRSGDKLEVVSHVKMQGATSALYWNKNRETASTVRIDLISTIKSPEQIARDMRESKIVEFMNTVGIDCRVTATKAVDAGYVREGK